MRRNAHRGRLAGILWLAALATLVATAAPAGAATLSSANGIVHYVAEQGERNDVLVGTSTVLGLPVYTFKDADALPITVTGGACEMLNNVGTCAYTGVRALHVNARDRDDTIKVAVAGERGMPAPSVPTVLIGGRGIDVIIGGNGRDKLKGNNGRDSLRGRKGADIYKGGRGSDVIQALDGKRDTLIACGEGRRDLVRADKVDPRPRRCELGGRKVSKPF